MLKSAGIILLLLMAVPAAGESITVSAAISLKEALSDVARLYQARTGDRVEINFGGSGQLVAQIQQGAPVDLFIAASPASLEPLRVGGLVAGSEQVVARNRLVLIAPADAQAPPTSLADLAAGRIRRIAVGQPKTVPAGEYGTQVLTAAGLLPAVHDRLVFGQNVRQVLAYVQRGEVDAALVYATDAREAGDTVRVVATLDESLHQPIVYPAVRIRSSHKPQAADRFLRFLVEPEAQKLLTARGFQPAGPPPATASAK